MDGRASRWETKSAGRQLEDQQDDQLDDQLIVAPPAPVAPAAPVAPPAPAAPVPAAPDPPEPVVGGQIMSPSDEPVPARPPPR